MTRLAEFRAAEKALAKQYAEFEAMKNDSELKKEIEFDNALNEFIAAHGMTRKKLLAFLSIEDGDTQPKKHKANRKIPDFPDRTLTNPHTGETITVKSLNNGKVRGWIDEHGMDTVKSWQVPTP